MKIFIFGPPGAGKSTMAFELSTQTKLPVYHIDHFFFKAPNIHVPSDQAMEELKQTLPNDNWIIEGNHGDALSYLAVKADHIIILGVPPLVCTYRVIKRHFQNDPILKKAISKGWEETLSWQFVWFCLWIFPENFPSSIHEIETICVGQVHFIKNKDDFDYKILGLEIGS